MKTILLNPESMRNKAEWKFICRDKNGKVKWIDEGINSLADEGGELWLDVFLRGATPPAGFFVRAYNDTPVKTDSLSDLTGEMSGNGYSAITLERSNVGWPTLALDNGNFQATSKTFSIIASGGVIGPMTHAVLATSSDNTGKLVAFYPFSVTRTLQDGDKLDITIREKLQPGA